MPPRIARTVAQAKSRQDRDSPAASSLDIPLPSAAAKPLPTTANRKRTQPATGSIPPVDPPSKRKRVESNQPNGTAAAATPTNDGDDIASIFDVTLLPHDALQRYMVHYHLVPRMYPAPDSRFTPPLPPLLLNPLSIPPQRSPSPPSGLATTTNRPRRDPKSRLTSNSRRSTRMQDDDPRQALEDTMRERYGNALLNDSTEADKVFSDIAQRHWDGVMPREGDILENFSWHLRARS